MSEAVRDELAVVETAEEEDMVVVLTKTYEFEGEKISELDFSGLENITANDMIKASKVLSNTGTMSVLPEMDLYYTLVIASECTGHPIEFFKTLKPRDAIKVKNKVTAYCFGEE